MLGAVPFVGSLLVEFAGTIIPNQRMDRIAEFAVALNQKLDRVEKDFIRGQFKNENFTDLFEEGLRQAAHSISDERRAYIAALVASSLSSKDIEYQESKHLLRILGEINDVEVIWLRRYLVRTFDGDQEFRERHKEVLRPITKVMGMPQSIRDKGTLQDSYQEHLTQLGLLESEYTLERPKKRGVDSGLKKYKLTSLGRLLLREIGLAE